MPECGPDDSWVARSERSDGRGWSGVTTPIATFWACHPIHSVSARSVFRLFAYNELRVINRGL